MELLKKIFPFSFKATDVASLVITIIAYLAAGVVLGFVIGLVAALPIIGIPFRLLGYLLELYIFAGIVLVVLDHCKILK